MHNKLNMNLTYLRLFLPSLEDLITVQTNRVLASQNHDTTFLKVLMNVQ